MQTTQINQNGNVTSTGRIPDPLDLLAQKAAHQERMDGAENDAQNMEASGEDEASPGVMTNAQCFSMMLEMLRDVLCGFAKVESPKTTLSNDKIAPAAEALGAVADKYGFNLSSAAGDYMVEIKAALVVIPIVLAMRVGLLAEIAVDKAKRLVKNASDQGLPVLNEPGLSLVS